MPPEEYVPEVEDDEPFPCKACGWYRVLNDHDECASCEAEREEGE